MLRLIITPKDVEVILGVSSSYARRVVRIIKRKNNKEKPDDFHLDQTLRPQSWEEYIGQSKTKENLRILLTAARERPVQPGERFFQPASRNGHASVRH